MTDPRHRHPGFEPSAPGLPGVPLPPRAPQVRPSTQRPPWFGVWSPGAIAAAVVAVIVALGGAQGIRELLGASEATQRAVAASEERILARLDEHSKVEREERAKIMRAAQVERERLVQHAELICALNDGSPHETWPCGELRLEPPGRGHVSPLWRTARRYPSQLSSNP